MRCRQTPFPGADRDGGEPVCKRDPTVRRDSSADASGGHRRTSDRTTPIACSVPGQPNRVPRRAPRTGALPAFLASAQAVGSSPGWTRTNNPPVNRREERVSVQAQGTVSSGLWCCKVISGDVIRVPNGVPKFPPLSERTPASIRLCVSRHTGIDFIEVLDPPTTCQCHRPPSLPASPRLSTPPAPPPAWRRSPRPSRGSGHPVRATAERCAPQALPERRGRIQDAMRRSPQPGSDRVRTSSFPPSQLASDTNAPLRASVG